MSVRVNFEIGHKASIRTKATPEGFTHDWEVYVRGSETHDIAHFVEKVIFYLHETFPNPRRVVKEPPFSVKESGYAGFVIPIEIYLKNKDEPKKINFQYDLVLHQTGPDTFNHMNEQHVFHSPNEDFKKKLLKGGGFITNHTYVGHEERSRDSFTDERPQLMSKPKLSGQVKKHKAKEHRNDIPKPSTSFVNLFGDPIHKPSKVSPDPKKIVPTPPPMQKSDKREKDKSSSEKEKYKSKYEHKEKDKKKEDKEKSKEDKGRSHKEAEKPKEKSSKRPSERPPSPSPQAPKKKCPSPVRRPPSPPVKPFAPVREEPKQQKQPEPEKKPKDMDPHIKSDKEKKPKKGKKEKSHDKDKDRKKDKEHKKEIHKVIKDASKEFFKTKEIENKKERETPAEPPPAPPTKEKPLKAEKPFNKFSIENMIKKPEPEGKAKDKDPDKKHKHKKKDKKRDDSREKHKEKKHKHERSSKEAPPEQKEPPQPEPEPELDEPIKEDTGSPISVSSQSSFKSDKPPKLDDTTGTSDSDSDSGPDDHLDDRKFKSKTPSRPPDPPKVEMKPDPAPEIEDKAGPSKDKSKKHKDKSKRTEGEEKKKRKRKSSLKEDDSENKPLKEQSKKDGAGASRSSKSETKLQDNGVSSSLGEEGEASETEGEPRGDRRDATPDAGDLSPDYMLRLKELQQRIMTIKSNEELERVVNLIAETGRYEVTTQTFDFDLCLLDRSTVQQLIELIG